MTVNQVRVLKIVRLLLASIYLYLGFNQTEFNPKLRTSYIFANAVIMVCALIIGSIIPKSNQFGNTFLAKKYKWLELGSEMGLMFLVSWLLSQF